MLALLECLPVVLPDGCGDSFFSSSSIICTVSWWNISSSFCCYLLRIYSNWGNKKGIPPLTNTDFFFLIVLRLIGDGLWLELADPDPLDFFEIPFAGLALDFFGLVDCAALEKSTCFWGDFFGGESKGPAGFLPFVFFVVCALYRLEGLPLLDMTDYSLLRETIFS